MIQMAVVKATGECGGRYGTGGRDTVLVKEQGHSGQKPSRNRVPMTLEVHARVFLFSQDVSVLKFNSV